MMIETIKFVILTVSAALTFDGLRCFIDYCGGGTWLNIMAASLVMAITVIILKKIKTPGLNEIGEIGPRYLLLPLMLAWVFFVPISDMVGQWQKTFFESPFLKNTGVFRTILFDFLAIMVILTALHLKRWDEKQE